MAELDAARITELARLLGAHRLGELIDILDTRLQQVMIQLQDGSGGDELYEVIHQSCGSASSLGLPGVAGSLGRLETLMRKAENGIGEGARMTVDRRAQILRRMSDIICELQDARLGATRLAGIAAHPH